MDLIATLFLIFIGIIVFFLIFTIIGGEILFKVVMCRQDNYNLKFLNIYVDEIKWLNNKEKKLLRIKTHDGLTLAGFMIKPENDSHKYVLAMHGYHAMYLESSRIAEFLVKKGFNYVMTSERAHHLSDGKYTTLGYKEYKDIISWLNYIVSIDKEAEIVLLGFSMGGASSLMAIGEILPNNLKCCIVDSAYSKIKEVLLGVFKKYTKFAPTKFMFYCLNNSCLFRGFNLNLDTKSQIRKSNVPTLLLQGTKDGLVPFKNLDYNFRGFKADTYHEKKEFQNSDHCRSVIDYPKEYLDTVLVFLNKFIK